MKNMVKNVSGEERLVDDGTGEYVRLKHNDSIYTTEWEKYMNDISFKVEGAVKIDDILPEEEEKIVKTTKKKKRIE